MPANVLEAWNFRKLLVCDDAAQLLSATAGQPLLSIDADETALFAAVPLLAKVHAARLRAGALIAAVRERAAGGGGGGADGAARVEAALARRDTSLLCATGSLQCLLMYGVTGHG